MDNALSVLADALPHQAECAWRETPPRPYPSPLRTNCGTMHRYILQSYSPCTRFAVVTHMRECML